MQLCDVLASVHATDPQAAAGLRPPGRDLPRRRAAGPRLALLPGRQRPRLHAATRDLDLFARTFRDPAPARDVSSRSSSGTSTTPNTPTWNAAPPQAPGRFPEALGPDYPPRGEAFLLERSRAGGGGRPARTGPGLRRGAAAAGPGEPGRPRPAGLPALPPRRHGPGGRAAGRLAAARPGRPLAAGPPGDHRAGARQRRAPRPRPSTAPSA